MLVYDDEDYPLFDIRVDDHTDPLGELSRLEHVARERWIHFRRFMPGCDSATGLLDRTEREAAIAQSIADKFV